MQKVLEIALDEVGYREGSGNVTKYAAELDRIQGFYNGAKNGYAWCDVFVDWCFVKAYGVELAKKLLCQPDYSAGAGCTYSAQYYADHGQFSRTPQVGAQIFFGNSQESTHTGLVYDVDENKVYTVEGNTSDMVAQRQYNRGDSNIYGYGLPDYSLVNAAQNWHEDGSEELMPIQADEYGGYPTERDEYLEVCAVDLPKLRFGDANNAVAAMQILLIRRGYSVGIDGADGDFGPNTLAALKRFQAAERLGNTGVADGAAWAALVRE